MADGADYTAAIKQFFERFYGTWPIGEPISLGDYGVLQGKMFERLGSLTDQRFAAWGVDMATRKDATRSMLEYKTSGSVALRFVAAGSAGSDELGGKAGLDVAFSKAKSILFAAADCVYTSIADKVALGRILVAKTHSGEWDRSWVVVTNVVRAGKTTVLMASSSDAKMKLSVSGVGPISGTAALFDAGVDFSVAAEQSMAFSEVSMRGATPLIGLGQVRRVWDPFPRRITVFEPNLSAPFIETAPAPDEDAFLPIA